MALSSNLFLMLFTFMLACNALSAHKALESVDAEAPTFEDGYVALDPKDPKVVELTKFSVDEYNKDNKANISLKGVLQAAYTHSDGGLLYGLIIEGSEAAKNDSKAYDVELEVTNQGDKKLLAFRERRYE